MNLSQFDVQHPLFKPLWLRLLIIGIGAAWTVVELRGGNWFWAGLFAVCTAYLVHQWLLFFNPVDPDEDAKK